MSFNPGDFDVQIILLRPSIRRGPQGEEIASFESAAVVFAQKEDTDIGERTSGVNYAQEQSVTIKIYKHPQVTTRWRVGMGGMVYEIIGIDPGKNIEPLMTLTLQRI